jgi:hypothetical protein
MVSRGIWGSLLLLVSLFGLGWGSPTLVWAQSVYDSAQSPTPSLTRDQLQSEIKNRMSRVVEFEAIKKMAEELGVRVWLFGGTAASYAHYVRWDLLREAGDSRYFEGRFDYDYTSIFRSTQDLDLVADGPTEATAKLRNAIQERFPYLQGGKSAWEVRLLREKWEDKEPLLPNSDFLKQHTDSNSIGLVELTDPPPGETVVRDLKDWEGAGEPVFLNDVLNGELHFYFSSEHERSGRAVLGMNPEILSAIRYLTKAFQYGLKILPEDMEKIQAIIDRFSKENLTLNWTSGSADRYVKVWIEKNAIKLFGHAMDIESAWNILEKTGLRQKLIDIRANAETEDSMAWWMSKEPLRSFPVGEGDGKTAAELGLDVVAHETKSFLAWESITRAPTGEPNVLISRQGKTGETAAYGDGFYTKVGRVGARGTGITIRFKVDPNAREGKDFTRSSVDKYIIFHNKNALRVIPESLVMTPTEYFEKLAAGFEFDRNDRGQIEKLSRRVRYRFSSLDTVEVKKIRDIVWAERKKAHPNEALFMEWFQVPQSARYPQVMLDFLSRNVSSDVDKRLVEQVFSKSQWVRHPEFVLRLIQRGNSLKEILNTVLSKPEWMEHVELYLAATEATARASSDQRDYTKLGELLNSSFLQKHVKLYHDIIRIQSFDRDWLVRTVLKNHFWTKHPELIFSLMKEGDANNTVFDSIVTDPRWLKAVPGLLEKYWDLSGAAKSSSAEWTLFKILENVPLEDAYSRAFVAKLLSTGLFDEALVSSNHANLVERKFWSRNPELLKGLVDRKTYNREVVEGIFAGDSDLISQIPLLERIIKSGEADREVAQHLLSKPEWFKHLELIEAFIVEGKSSLWALDKYVLTKPELKNNPVLRELCGGKDPTAELLQEAFRAGKSIGQAQSAPCLELLTK